MRGQAIFAFSTALSLVTPSTKGYSSCIAILSQKKLFHRDGRNRQDLSIIRPPGIEPGGFVLTPDSVWYCRVLLIFSFSTMTDTGSRSFDCALVAVMEQHDRRLARGNDLIYFNYLAYMTYLTSITRAII